MENTKTLLRSVLVATGLIIASAGAANAQMTTNMKFTTTFPFMIGNRSMPAGAYTVRPMDGDPALLEFSNGHSSVLVLTDTDKQTAGRRQDEVIFSKQGETYVLREVWDASTSTGAEAIEQTTPHHHATAR